MANRDGRKIHSAIYIFILILNQALCQETLEESFKKFKTEVLAELETLKKENSEKDDKIRTLETQVQKHNMYWG